MSKLADYAIVLMTSLARSEVGTRSASELAAQTGIPLPTVAKLLKVLAREGLLESQRGLRGGYGLPRSPDQISVADIVQAVDGPVAMTECCSGRPEIDCVLQNGCSMEQAWRRIGASITTALEAVSLRQISSPSVWGLAVARGAKAVPVRKSSPRRRP